MKKTIWFITLFLTFVCLTACEEDDQCRKNRYVRLEAGFYKANYNSETNLTSVSEQALENLSVQGLGSDSVLYKNDTLSSIVLPLRKFSGESRYQIKYGNTTDTVTIVHTNTDTYLSLECGCIKTFVVDSVYSTKHFIDSVKISQKEVNANTSAQRNIKIYN